MGLSRSVIHPRFAAHHKLTVKSLMRAKVGISRTLSEGVYDPVAGAVTGGSSLSLYVGKAAIEKVARPTRRDFVFDAADNQVIEVQIPLELADNELEPEARPDFQSGDRVTVLECGDNPSIVGEVYYLHGDAGASIAWDQTLVCRTSAKQG